MKGKLINGVLQYAPSTVIYENTKYRPVPDEVLTALGYKDVVTTPAPEPAEGMQEVSSWEEVGDEIVQVWTSVPLPPQDAPSEDETLRALLLLLKGQTEALPDEAAQDVPELFPTWTSLIGTAVETGTRVYDDKKLWKCVQGHTVQAEWRPELTPALWVRVYVEEWPEWVRPQSSADAYMIGDKVTYNGHHYISTIDYNTWSPEEYSAGWELVE